MTKIVCVGKQKTLGGRTFRVYCLIKFNDGKLCISGVEGPLQSGSCLGACGQIQDNLYMNITEPAPDWTYSNIYRFVRIWKVWHFNNTKVPQNVIDWLFSLPTSETTPAWV